MGQGCLSGLLPLYCRNCSDGALVSTAVKVDVGVGVDVDL